MKIISKYKDYYDYLQGIYGVDNMKVLDRRSDNPYTKLETIVDSNKDRVYHYIFAICDELYDVFYRNGILYHTYDEYVKLCNLHSENITISYKNQRYEYNNNNRYGSIHISKDIWDELQGRKININSKKRNPILVYEEPMKFIRNYDYNDNVILSDFKFIKKLDAKSIYTKLDTFLGWLHDNPEIKSVITNDEKIKSKGFDIKKSFRHRK